MSETVHYRGRMTEIKPRHSVDLNGVAREICDSRGLEKQSFHRDYVELLCDELYDEYITINQKLFSLEKVELDCDEEIMRAEQNLDGSISYEVRYYNGGCGFNEAVEEALDKNGIEV